MNVLLILENFENKFLFLSFRTKLQLYLLPLLLIALLYQSEFLFKQDIKPQKISEVPQNNKFKESYLELFEQIDKISKENQVELLNIKRAKKEIYISFKSPLNNFLRFVKEIEKLNNFTNIIKLKNEKIKDDFIFEGVINLDKYYEKKFLNSDKKSSIKHKFILKAIIGNYVVIDNKILEIGEVYKDYKITKIEKKTIYLENNRDILKLEIKDEFTKFLN